MSLATREGRQQQGARIKLAAQAVGLSLDDLAKQIGCSRALIYQYASGASLVQTDRLQQIAAVVGKPLPWFFVDDPDSEESERWTDASEIAAARARLEQDEGRLREEQERFITERSRLEAQRIQEKITHLRALMDAHSTPVDWRLTVDSGHQLLPLLEQVGDRSGAAELLLMQGNALCQLNEWGPAREALESAGALFRELDMPHRFLYCLQSLGHVSLMLGRPEEALRQFQQVAAGESWWNRWQGTLSLGAVHETLGDYQSAAAAFEQTRRIIEEGEYDSDREAALLYVDANWANVEIACGDYSAALERAERCVRAAQRLGMQDQYIEALLTRGAALMETGAIHPARPLFEQALDVAMLAKDHQRAGMAQGYLSLLGSARQQWPVAVRYGKESLASALRSGAARAEVLAQRALAEAYLGAANLQEAKYHLDQATGLAASGRMKLIQAQLHALHAEWLLASGDLAAASVAASLALQLALSLGARPVQYRAHLVLSRTALEADRLSEALSHASEARGLGRAMDLGFSEWTCDAVLGAAYVRMGDDARASSLFQQAIDALRRNRETAIQASGEDTLLEDRHARRLWEEWILLLLRTADPPAARTAAESADWPPLVEWLQARSTTGEENGHE